MLRHAGAPRPDRGGTSNKSADGSVETIGDAIEVCASPSMKRAFADDTVAHATAFRVAFNTDDLTFAPDKPCCEDGNVTSAKPKSRSRIPRSQGPLLSKDTFGERIEVARLGSPDAAAPALDQRTHTAMCS